MKYDDIIHLSRPTSQNHMPMPMKDRAAQFAPFAALTGHGSAISETARLTEKQIVLDESEKEILNRKLNFLAENIKFRPMVTLTHFVQDELKSGGEYVRTSGRLKKMDTYRREIILDGVMCIFIDEVIEIEWEEFENQFNEMN